jgi:carboxymethylenebutenolidase
MTRGLVTFPAGGAELRGWLHTPAGSGPFPAVVWSHGSERRPGSCDALGRFYAAAGYVLFVPHRRGHGRSPGEYELDAVPRRPRREAIAAVLALHERRLEDTLGAVRWLREQPIVDARRLVVSGVSHGGIQTILAAEADGACVACVPFAPAAMAWRGNPELQERLVQAVRRARAPMFLLQAANDYSLGPSEMLGAELAAKGPPNRVRVYPAYGRDRATGHGQFALRGTAVWGADVLAFLREVLVAPPLAAGASPPR